MEGARMLRQRLPLSAWLPFGPGLCPGRRSPRLLRAGLSCCSPWGSVQNRPLRRHGAPPFFCPSDLSRHFNTEASQAMLASMAPVFSVMKFDKDGNISCYERKKTELYQELSLQPRDLRFQHQVSISPRNNKIVMRMEFLKAVVTTEYLVILDYRNGNLENWLFKELSPQLAGEGQLVTYSLPFEFRAIEAILQYWIGYLHGKLNSLQPQILETLNALVDPKLLSLDRSKVHILLQNGKSLAELETDLKVFKETVLEILDDEEVLEELCLSKWTDPRVFHRNVMMRLNLQLTMGTFSLSLFGLMGVAFGMNLESSFEEDHRAFWLVTGIMCLGSGLIWRWLLSFLGRHLQSSTPVSVTSLLKRTPPANGKVEIKSDFKTEPFGSSRSTVTNQ
ncbi:magnesium transporter MRS2 homolog, mitochondrial isoform X2 [Pogona vitticeps]|uniref:Magnesium transporter n=1 Tax=Pogona vitticeps TaxID=103695 RepID=A0ABM5GAV8_9SAUR